MFSWHFVILLVKLLLFQLLIQHVNSTDHSLIWKKRPTMWKANSACRPNWQQHGWGCYRHVEVNHPITWNDAQWFCLNHGGHLPTISSSWKKAHFFKVYKVHCTSTHQVYMGYHNVGKWMNSEKEWVNSDWQWVDGGSSRYTNWLQNKKSKTLTKHDQMCSSLLVSLKGKWQAVSCWLPRNTCLLCEYDPWCPEGWTVFDGSCFRHFKMSSNITWNEASRSCRAVGADLVSITSTQRQAFLNSMAMNGGWYYIGYSDKWSQGDWAWSSGSDSEYTNWNNEEDMQIWKNCAAAHEDWKWKSVSCNTTNLQNFVCEMKLPW